MGNELEKNKNLNWKQWIPIYGVYQAGKDYFEGKPSNAEFAHQLRFIASIMYHSSSVAILSGIMKGLEKYL